MNRTTVFPVSPASSLEDLRRIIEDQEWTLGEILAISTYQQQATWLTYTLVEPPKKNIQVTYIDSATAPVPKMPEYQAICIGDAYINGTPKLVAVYRKV